MNRKPTSKPTKEVDFLVPIGNVEGYEEVSCFGKAWDMSASECNQCADRDVCGIIFQRVVDEKAKEIEKKAGTKFLDETCFKNVNENSIRENFPNGAKVTDLILLTQELSKCDDIPSITAFLKRFLKENKWITIKAGLVWID